MKYVRLNSTRISVPPQFLVLFSVAKTASCSTSSRYCTQLLVSYINGTVQFLVVSAVPGFIHISWYCHQFMVLYPVLYTVFSFSPIPSSWYCSEVLLLSPFPWHFHMFLCCPQFWLVPSTWYCFQFQVLEEKKKKFYIRPVTGPLRVCIMMNIL